ncbi:MAG: sigma-70 family RNA polymerase sigma factor [Casimicrobiaceae bacterium]
MASVDDIAGELEQHRGYLMRISRLQLRDDALAEDVVQETMLAALGAGRFSGESSLRTWLTSILKHKIVDAIRKRQRQSEISGPSEAGGYAADHDEFDSPFDADGSWEAGPASWGNPEQALHQRQFFDVLALCMENLPANTARVFVMREYMEFDVAEISRELAITAAHVYVILYRARVRLRQCLEERWFGNHSTNHRMGKAT